MSIASKTIEETEEIRQFALENGVALFGTCILEGLKSDFHLEERESRNLEFAISMGIRLSKAVLDGIDDEPTLLYKWHYRQANIQLDKLAFLLSLRIQEMGWRALPIPASQVIDWKKQVGHLSHRHVAVKSGLGWLGRNNLLVCKEFGAQVRLVTILTNMPLPQGIPQDFGCGECHKCVEVCPVQALGESHEDFDFDRCYEKLQFFSRKRNLNLHICGICVKACPGRVGTSLG